MDYCPKKTIIYVGGFELPDKNAAAHRVLNNGKIFRELGYKVVFLGIGHSCKRIICEEFFGFECWSVPYPQSTKNWISYLTNFSVLRKLIHQETPEGIIFYNYQSISFLKALLYCKKTKIWTISDVTEWYLATGGLLYRTIKQLDTSFRMRILNKKVDSIIVISSFLESYYQCKGKNIVIKVPPLIDKSEPKWRDPIDREPGDKIVLIYAGSTSDLKDNLGYIYNAVKEHKEHFVFQIVGMNFDSVQRLIGEKNLDPSLMKVFGRLPHNMCLKMIKESDFQVFIRPDNIVTRAGFPTKLGESFACGTPVITNPSSNISDYIVDGENGFLVEAENSESLSQILAKVETMNRKDIDQMKLKCSDIDVFDYHHYTGVFSEIVKALRSKEEITYADE